ncbi:hypothetical protein [Bradyrhizobium sp. CCBAU 25338]|jgi:malonate transporter|uniref:hypothetical protein n=1 Tax=Bradyrhizobium sp. CCBAU 25338 TaxID=1641877 RepID=UPI0023039900|nr:hypothetical protein [Bradyrhizobium sp. CCBAU 25338]
MRAPSSRQSRYTHRILGVAGSAAGPIALGINLFRFEVKGEKLSIPVMCALKLLAMPAAAFVLARLLDLPPLAVVVLFAAMRPARTRTSSRCSISGW